MKFRYVILINSLLNLSMAAAMSITADLLHGSLSVRTLLMMLIGFCVGMILSLIIPLNNISNWTNNTLKVKNKFLKVLVGNVIPCIIMTSIITLTMTIINVGFQVDTVFAFLSTLPIMLLVSYIVIVIVNPLSLKLVLKLMEK